MQLKTDHRTVRLISGDREQSVWRKDQPDYIVHSYAQLIALALLTWRGYATRSRGRALIIGLGGGILCRFLLKHFPNLSIEVVEPDARVIEIAREHFDLDRRVSVHCHDGRGFMEGRTGKFDIVVLDAFDSTYIPAELMTLEFLELVKKRLYPDGLFITNTWVLRDITPHEDATYRRVFGSAWDFRRRPNTDGNRIMLINGAAGNDVGLLGRTIADRAALIDERYDLRAQALRNGVRRMLTYSDMAQRLEIKAVAPGEGKILSDANVRLVRAKASFENEE